MQETLGTIKVSQVVVLNENMYICSCYSTKTYVNSVILILKLNLTSMRNIYVKLCVVLNEDHF